MSGLKFYCEVCDKCQPIKPVVLKQDNEFPENGIWDDIVCDHCHFVIATVFAEQEGTVSLTPDKHN